MRVFQIEERKLVISTSVAVEGRRNSAFAKLMMGEGFADEWRDGLGEDEWAESPRFGERTIGISPESERRWDVLRRDWLRDATASLESRLTPSGIGVRGRERDGGSEARESRMPAILRVSCPRSVLRAKMVGR